MGSDLSAKEQKRAEPVQEAKHEGFTVNAFVIAEDILTPGTSYNSKRRITQMRTVFGLFGLT